MNPFVIILMLSCFLLNSSPLFAQAEPIKKNDPLSVDFRPLKSEVFRGKFVAANFAKLYKEDEEIIALADDLKKKGFQAQKWVHNFWGIQQTYRIKDKIVTYSFHIQDYAKTNSKDLAAIGQVRVIAEDGSQIYSFYLEAPDGDFDNAIEYRINEKLKIMKADSWWSYVKSGLAAYPAICEASLADCAAASWVPSWVGYLRCIAAACGLAYTKASACSGWQCQWWCKWWRCQWWCKWGVGCCDR